MWLGFSQTLHRQVLNFMQVQGELWAQLPTLANTVSLRMSQIVMDPQQVEVSIVVSESVMPQVDRFLV